MAATPMTLPNGEPLTGAQLECYNALREYVHENIASNPEFEQQKQWLVDTCVRRYCTAWKYNLATAKKEITATVAWRCKMGINSLSIDTPATLPCAKLMYSYWNGYTNDGSPIMYVRMRLHDANLDRKDRIQFFLYIFEIGTRLMLLGPNPRMEQWTIIMDEKGKSGKNNDMKFLQALGQPMFHHYVERLKRVFVLHPSMTFSIGYKIIATFLDEKTKAKLTLIDKSDKKNPSNPYPKLTEWCGKENLEEEFGGTAKAVTADQFILRCKDVEAKFLMGGGPGPSAGLADMIDDAPALSAEDAAAADAAADEEPGSPE